MTRPLSIVQAVLLATTAFGAVVLAACGLHYLADRAGWSAQYVHLHAAFDDVAGLEVGARVRLQGLEIGDVMAVVPPTKAGEPVDVELRIRERFHPLIAADARVQLGNESLLGGKILQVVRGRTERIVEPGATLGTMPTPDALESLAQSAQKLNRLLDGVEEMTRELRHGEEQGRSVAQELHSSVKRLSTVLESAERAMTQVESGKGTLGKLVYDEKIYHELSGTLVQAQGTLQDLRTGQGTLGKLLKNNDAYGEALAGLQNFQRTLTSIKQSADAVKSLPFVRSYVQDPLKELIRPECKRQRRWHPEGDLFEPGQALLTSKGKAHLDETGQWLNENRDAKSEIVVASFTTQEGSFDYLATLTQKQSQVVCDYLRSKHAVHNVGSWWHSRPLRAVGCGNTPNPVPESEMVALGRVEVLLFTPQE